MRRRLNLFTTSNILCIEFISLAALNFQHNSNYGWTNKCQIGKLIFLISSDSSSPISWYKFAKYITIQLLTSNNSYVWYQFWTYSPTFQFSWFPSMLMTEPILVFVIFQKWQNEIDISLKKSIHELLIQRP